MPELPRVNDLGMFANYFLCITNHDRIFTSDIFDVRVLKPFKEVCPIQHGLPSFRVAWILRAILTPAFAVLVEPFTAAIENVCAGGMMNHGVPPPVQNINTADCGIKHITFYMPCLGTFARK